MTSGLFLGTSVAFARPARAGPLVLACWNEANSHEDEDGIKVLPLAFPWHQTGSDAVARQMTFGTPRVMAMLEPSSCRSTRLEARRGAPALVADLEGGNVSPVTSGSGG